MDSTMTDNITTNSALARRVADVAEALASYDHLPTPGHVSVHSITGSVYMGTCFRVDRDPVRDVCVWADAFGVPVVIDLSDTGRVVAVLELGGVAVSLHRHIDHRHAYEYGAALGIPVSPGGQVQVDAMALLAVLDRQNEVAA